MLRSRGGISGKIVHALWFGVIHLEDHRGSKWLITIVS